MVREKLVEGLIFYGTTVLHTSLIRTLYKMFYRRGLGPQQLLDTRMSTTTQEDHVSILVKRTRTGSSV